MRVFRLVVCVPAAAAVLSVSGCGGSTRPAPRSASFTLPSVAASAALAPALYMQVASSSSLFAIRASEIAAERSANINTRSAAQSIIRDQGGVASQLSFAGRRLELLPTAALSPDQSAELDRLRESADFDSDNRRAVGGALSRAYEAHAAFARAGSSPTLIPVARMAAPVTKRNLDSLGR